MTELIIVQDDNATDITRCICRAESLMQIRGHFMIAVACGHELQADDGVDTDRHRGMTQYFGQDLETVPLCHQYAQSQRGA